MTPTHRTKPPFALRSRDIYLQLGFRHRFDHGGRRGGGDADGRSVWRTGDVSTHGTVAEDGSVGKWGHWKGEMEEGAVAVGENGGGHYINICSIEVAILV